MAQPEAFAPVKLVCGVIAGEPSLYELARALLVERHGPVDLELDREEAPRPQHDVQRAGVEGDPELQRAPAVEG